MHAIHMQIWSIAIVKETLRLWQDVHAELQEEDVLLYSMEEEETTNCVPCVMTWKRAQMMEMGPQRRTLLQVKKFKTYNLSRKIRKLRKKNQVN
jgi:hypothetical protein